MRQCTSAVLTTKTPRSAPPATSKNRA